MITEYHAKLFAHELGRRRSAADAEKLAGTLLNAQVDLNPHQVEAALFAFRSPLSMGVILADEVGLGKTIEAAWCWRRNGRRAGDCFLSSRPRTFASSGRRRSRKSSSLPTVILEARNYNKMAKDGVRRPFEQKNWSSVPSSSPPRQPTHAIRFTKRAVSQGQLADLRSHLDTVAYVDTGGPA